MTKFFKTIACILSLCFCVAFFAACGENNGTTPPGGTTGPGGTPPITGEEKPPVPGEEEKPTVPGGEEKPPVPGEDEEVLELEDFGLADEIASINIVTDGNVPIEGGPQTPFGDDAQPYYGCSVTVTEGREGENFSERRAQVRVRGNNTAEYDKKSFRLKFDKKVNLLGLNGGNAYKSWVLLACYKDVTFLRDVVVFELAKHTLKENGLYASDYSFAEVSINGEYNGLYMVAEQQQVNTSRVDINEPEEGYEGVDIGYFVEYDGNAPATEKSGYYFSLNYGDYMLTCENGTEHIPEQWHGSRNTHYTIKNDIYGQDIKNSQQHKFIMSYVDNVFKIMYDAIYNGTYTTFNADYTAIVPSGFTDSRTTLEAVVDIPSLVDMFILQEVACDNDVDWSSFFFSVDMSATGNKKLTFQAPWDFDSGFGMMRRLEELDQIFTGNVSTNAAQGLNPWLALPVHADWFMQEVALRWNNLVDEGVFDRLINLIDVVTEGYETYFVRNYEKWDNLGVMVDPVQSETIKTFKTHSDASGYLKNWLAHRIEFLTEYFSAEKQ